MASNLKMKSQSRGSVLSDLLLVWDWSDATGDPEDRQLYEAFMESRGSEYIDSEPSCHLESVKRVLSMILALEEAEEWNAVEE
ncbi:hypothetical protein N7493_009850 [Penicillium malachiteum]|uniref:Uncharacterized protein n=1 Tax=Penicillium malachiteum TaxID=1324776 RepID=A0AAD6HE19_9EURO|nr:hypothetical protein N7493_009850 [Penicillium malachiteum]